MGVDGVASNEHGGLAEELHQALLFARARLVDGDELRTADVAELAAANRAGARELAERGGLL